MNPEQIKAFILGGRWISIAPEIRPSQNKTSTGDIQPFYLTRTFIFSPGDKFELTVINNADPFGKIPLAKILIKGHFVFQGEHPIASGAYNVDYIADQAYEVTPLHQGFADAVNKFPTEGLNKWELNVAQSLLGKAFPLFGLVTGKVFAEYDLIYIYNDMLFNGSRNVDGRGFDKPENRPTNLQIPLIRKS